MGVVGGKVVVLTTACALVKGGVSSMCRSHRDRMIMKYMFLALGYEISTWECEGFPVSRN